MFTCTSAALITVIKWHTALLQNFHIQFLQCPQTIYSSKRSLPSTKNYLIHYTEKNKHRVWTVYLLSTEN